MFVVVVEEEDKKEKIVEQMDVVDH